MKNIHILPTDKPSRLHYWNGILKIDNSNLDLGLLYQNICITNDAEIKAGDWVLLPKYTVYPYNNIKKMSHSDILDYLDSQSLATKKIILTTDQVLIKDGVQAIPDEFLEWFVKNPSCEEVEVEKWTDYKFENNKEVAFFNYKIIIPKEEPKQDSLEEAAEKWVFETNGHKWSNNDDTAGDNYGSFIAGAKWQQERSYSEEDMRKAINFMPYHLEYGNIVARKSDKDIENFIEEFKKK